MNKTKQKILDTALLLFNKHGLSKTTLRTIANELGISQGNLCYHFKKREDIIEQLYYQLVENIDKGILDINLSDISVKTMYTLYKTIAFEFYDYRFFLLDFTQIMRTHQNVKSHYNELITIRNSQMLLLIEELISKELLRKEELPNEYENLYTRIQILSDFWMSSLSIKTDVISKETTEQYIGVIFENIYPYLTKKGILEYQKIAV